MRWLFIAFMFLSGCMEANVRTVDLPYGTKATGVSIRDGFTNNAALIVYDKDGSIHKVVAGTATTAATTWSSVANGALIDTGGTALEAEILK